MILYKYTSEFAGLKTLLQREIRFTQINALNDPFESHLPVTELITDSTLSNMLDSFVVDDDFFNLVVELTVDQLYSKLDENFKNRFPKNVFSTYVLNQVKLEVLQRGQSLQSFVYDMVQNKKQQFIADARNRIPDLLGDEIAILSLSTICDNEVMWSHYADSHRGIAIGFNAEYGFFENIIEVKYQSKRPPIDGTQKLSRVEFISTICGIKNEAWAYEQEYRLVESVRALRDTGEKDVRNVPVFVKQFEPSMIHSIIFGCHNTEKTSQSISSELSKADYSHVKLYHSKLDKENRKLTIESFN